MTGADVKSIRKGLGIALGRHVSQQSLGLILGLAPGNAARTVRGWEDGEAISGPATAALTFLGHANDQSHHAVRDFVCATALELWQQANRTGADCRPAPQPLDN